VDDVLQVMQLSIVQILKAHTPFFEVKPDEQVSQNEEIVHTSQAVSVQTNEHLVRAVFTEYPLLHPVHVDERSQN
jgi:hypothetical protein